MVSKSETGHAINVANFKDLISNVEAFGASYKPSNVNLAIAAMQTIAESASQSVVDLNAEIALYNKAVATREVVFDPLSPFITRIMNMLKVSGVSRQIYDSVNTVARKIKGTRATPKVTAPEATDKSGKVIEVRQVSTSQMSYESRAENFDKMIQLLSAIPEYAPNEEELQLEALIGLSSAMKTRNAAVVTSDIAVRNSRISRNDILYAENSGLCDTALLVKDYAKAIFGANSPQYHQIAKIKFTKQK